MSDPIEKAIDEIREKRGEADAKRFACSLLFGFYGAIFLVSTAVFLLIWLLSRIIP